MKLYFVAGCLCIPFLLFAQSQTASIRHGHGMDHRTLLHSRIQISEPGPDVIQTLLEAGVDLHCSARYIHDNGTRNLQIECSQQELAYLGQKGISYEMLIDDVSAFYAGRARANLAIAKQSLDAEKGAAKRSAPDVCSSPQHIIPQNFQLGDFGGFLYYEQILATLDTMAMLYPELISVKAPLSDSLNTIEGRPVYWVRISDQAGVDEDEPEVLYTGLTHAREPSSAMSLIYYMWYLLENYGSDPEITRLVDQRELYFIPVVNPDGYLRNAGLAPEGGGMWRKNLRDNNDDDFISGSDGVDLNRNYGYLWGHDDIGSSPDPAMGNYRGLAPFSEPEIRMVRDFVLQHEFVVAMHNHSYGDDLYYPWEFGDSTLADHSAFARISELMTAGNRYLYGELYETYWLGSINGGANDWFYGEQSEKSKIFSWIPEIGSAFWPDPVNIVSICQDQLEPHMMAALFAGQHALIHDLNPPVVHHGGNALAFRIENLGLKGGYAEVRINSVGKGVSNVLISNNLLHFDTLPEAAEVEVTLEIDPSLPYGSEVFIEIEIHGTEGRMATLAVHKSVTLPSISFPADMWQSDTWGPCTGENGQIPGCLTDSPEGNQVNDVRFIQLDSFLDLRNYESAHASFFAKWEIEPTHDFCQMQARLHGKQWIPVCGRYTKPGSGESKMDIPSPFAGQPEGKPVYDGMHPEWVREVADLSDFIGFDSVALRFVIWSGPYLSDVTEDGFSFADFQVYMSLPVHCLDGEQNADEEGVDCGGSSCTPCSSCADQIQNGDEDGVDCGGSHCAPCPTCDDGVQNGSEEGIDCGGADCAACPACDDGEQNGDEEDIDCGGTTCEPCPTCVDSIQNGLETGIDCGGPDCEPCVPTCHDRIQNGDEEGVDCGGTCEPCKTFCCDPGNKPYYELTPIAARLQPNPAADKITLTFSDAISVDELSTGEFQYEILDLTGRSYRQAVGSLSEQVSVDLPDLSAQMYLVRIVDEYGRCVVLRFLKA